MSTDKNEIISENSLSVFDALDTESGTATDATSEKGPSVEKELHVTVKKPRKSAKRKKTDVAPETLEIENDLYSLYIESYSHKKGEIATLDLFDAIEEEEQEELLPNTAYLDGTETDQIAFSDSYDDFEDIEPEEEPYPEVEKTLAPYDEKKPRKIDARFDFLELFIFTLLAVMILTSFFFKHSIVEGGSMQNTLQSGEHLIISDLFYTPAVGDLIVCEDYSTGIRKPIVKRVIAVGGDHLQITETGEIRVNGELLIEEYVYLDGAPYYPPTDTTLPEGMIYVMGDHRNASTDSRIIGLIDEDAVLGKVLLRFYPFNSFTVFD